MGALPVDTIGSKHEGWHSSPVDESHARESAPADEKEETDGEIVAVGTGPDPEHSDL
jgi:hypothetical protein